MSAVGPPLGAKQADGARIDALIAEARTLARTGAGQRALTPALEAAALAQRVVDPARSAPAAEGGEMLAAVDARLYEAKRAGRNCVR
jgi:GGDEF domain-containing protein